MKWLKRIGCYSGAFIFILVLGMFLVIQITPLPVAYITQYAFSNKEDKPLYGRHPDFENMRSSVLMELDLSYDSPYKNSTYDRYVPKDTSTPYPTIVWIHGGAFVGGDKKDMQDFAIALSSQGYQVLVMNYALAQEQPYPTPLYQVHSFLSTIQENNALNQLYIGGDSAGAHIAFQFVTTQLNASYREKMDMSQVIDPSLINGVISFCGLLDITMYDETDSTLSNFLYNQSAWAYFKDRNWKENADVLAANFLPYIDESFPATYLTDGDKNSFLQQAIQMEELLKEKQVEVESLLWMDGNHPHEYQFHLDQEAAIQNFEKLLYFLKQTTK